MTQEQVFRVITSELKWYIGFCSQPYASQLITRFNNGNLKQETIEKMFKFYGYVVNKPTTWIKSEGKPINLKTK